MIRRTVLKILKMLAVLDVHIKHPFSGRKFCLHPFHHKGYWFHGRKRESEELAGFQRIVRPGDCVWEVGAHTGFVTHVFAHLVGDGGRVVAFEPGPQNLRYLDRNIKPFRNTELQPLAVCDRTGTVTLHTEDLTGQNNSMVADLPVLAANAKNAGMAPAMASIQVAAISLDDFKKSQTIQPDFIKIDVEGVEHQVLTGATELLSQDRPALMVELMMEREKSLDILLRNNYRCFYPDRSEVDFQNLPDKLFVNIFAFPTESPRLATFLA